MLVIQAEYRPLTGLSHTLFAEGVFVVRMVELSVPTGVDPEDSAYVENPVTGERFHFHSRPDTPATDPLGVDIWAISNMSPLAEHVHPRQNETFVVNSGTMELSQRGDVKTLTVGDEATAEAGTPHTWSNAGDEELHLSVQFEPALESEAFLRDLATLAQRGEVKSDGAPSLLQVAVLYDAYGYDLLHLASPPLSVQKVLFGALAPLAKNLGYRAKPVAGAGSAR